MQLIRLDTSSLFSDDTYNHKKQIEPALQAAKRANIPVIIIDAPVSDESLVNCTIVSDNYDAGVQCAKDMMERLDSANIVLLKHTTAKSAKERIEGFLSVIDNNEKYKVINEAELIILCSKTSLFFKIAMPVFSLPGSIAKISSFMINLLLCFIF